MPLSVFAPFPFADIASVLVAVFGLFPGRRPSGPDRTVNDRTGP